MTEKRDQILTVSSPLKKEVSNKQGVSKGTVLLLPVLLLHLLARAKRYSKTLYAYETRLDLLIFFLEASLSYIIFSTKNSCILAQSSSLKTFSPSNILAVLDIYCHQAFAMITGLQNYARYYPFRLETYHK